MKLSPLSRLLIGLAALTTLVIVGQDRRTAARNHLLESPPDVPYGFQNLYVPSTPTLRVATAGYDQAAADLLWVRVLGYFGEHMATDKQYTWLEIFIEQILSLDPAFQKVYEIAAVIVLYGSDFSDENVRKSNRFYRLALERFPNNYEAAFSLGFNYYFEMKGKDEAERAELREKGLAYFTMAASMPGAPVDYQGLVASLYSQAGQVAVAQRHYIDLYLRTEDPVYRRVFKQRLEEQGVDVSAIEAEYEAIEARRKARYPYLPFDTYLLLDGHL